MSRKPVPVNLKSDKEQIASVREGGLEVCRQSGHLRSNHYNTSQNRIEIRCSRCGRILGLEKTIKEKDE